MHRYCTGYSQLVKRLSGWRLSYDACIVWSDEPTERSVRL